MRTLFQATSHIVTLVCIIIIQLKICVTLMVAATLEVERGIQNLWKQGVGHGFKDNPDFGQYIPQNYFQAFVAGFPHLWSPKEYWYVDNIPWESFLPLLSAFNGKRRDLVSSTYLVLDESMSAWRPKTSKFGGLPNITYEARKPKPLGTMLNNGVEATTGIMVYQDMVQQKEVQQAKKYNGDPSSMPLKEEILQHVGEVLRQCEGANLVEGGWVGGDAWFGSIPAVVELKKKKNVYSTFILKQHVQYCPKQIIHAIIRARSPKYPAGRHVVMKATISGVETFLLVYAFSNNDFTYMVSLSGTTISHEKVYRSNFTDEYGNTTFKEIPRPCVAHFLYELLPLIDNHNKDQQSLLALEDCWPTKSPWFQLVTTLVGMAVTNVHRWDRNQRGGKRPLLEMRDDDEDPSYLNVRTFANLIAKGLRCDKMTYCTTMRYSYPARRTDNGSGVERITNEEGEISRLCGKRKRDFQQSCFMCKLRHGKMDQHTSCKLAVQVLSHGALQNGSR